MDLRSVIQEELQSNPTLEEMPMEGVSIDKEQQSDGKIIRAPTAKTTTAGENNTAEQSDELDFSKSKEFEILGKLDADWRDYMASRWRPALHLRGCRETQHFFDSLVSETSLQSTSSGRPNSPRSRPRVSQRCATWWAASMTTAF